MQTNNNGYRLPASMEWEMAARWRNTSGDGSIFVGGRYWIPANYASGAKENWTNEAKTRAVAWYKDAPGGNFTRPVGLLLPNHLGMYDMSGNVEEWLYDLSSYSSTGRSARGGSIIYHANHMSVGRVSGYSPDGAGINLGFRLARGQ